MSEDLISRILTKKCSEIEVCPSEKFASSFCPDIESPVTNLHSEVLPPTVLQDIDLHLECDEDGIFSVPGETTISSLPHSVIGQNVCLRITFPLPTQTTDEEKVIWTCSVCEEKYGKQSKLAYHLRDVHKIEKNFQCPQCSFATTALRLLRRHSARKHSQRHKTQNSVSDVENHPSEVVNEEDDVNVDSGTIESNSGVADASLLNVKNIFKDSSPTSLPSSDSKAPVTTTSNEREPDGKSYSQSHSGRDNFLYVCSKCPYQTSRKHHLATHFTVIHDPKRETYKCKDCDYECKQKQTLLSHETKHERSRSLNVCNSCGKDCRSVSALKRHSLIHMETNKVVCKVQTCGKVFKNCQALSSHMYKVHHSRKLRTEEQNYHSLKKRSSFICSWSGCGKTFRDNHNLKTHMCLHTGTRPMKCPYCMFTCVQKTSLSCHIKKMHT